MNLPEPNNSLFMMKTALAPLSKKIADNADKTPLGLVGAAVRKNKEYKYMNHSEARNEISKSIESLDRNISEKFRRPSFGSKLAKPFKSLQNSLELSKAKRSRSMPALKATMLAQKHKDLIEPLAHAAHALMISHAQGQKAKQKARLSDPFAMTKEAGAGRIVKAVTIKAPKAVWRGIKNGYSKLPPKLPAPSPTPKAPKTVMSDGSGSMGRGALPAPAKASSPAEPKTKDAPSGEKSMMDKARGVHSNYYNRGMAYARRHPAVGYGVAGLAAAGAYHTIAGGRKPKVVQQQPQQNPYAY